MTINTDDVRKLLRNMPESAVPDETVSLNIEIATLLISNEKSENATDDMIDKAILLHATYQSYMAYAVYYERSTGSVPPPILNQLARYEKLSDIFLDLVRRGTVATGPVLTQIQTLWQDYEGGAYS